MQMSTRPAGVTKAAMVVVAAMLFSATVAVMPTASQEAPAASASDAPSVRGSWAIRPQTEGPPFQALAAFAAGGSFITTGSDQAGTGIGQWIANGADGFTFSYQNFHFAADGKLASITTVNATGTFDGDTMTGTATESAVDASGAPIGVPRTAAFTGQRMKATAP